jgi:hypothetical protein
MLSAAKAAPVSRTQKANTPNPNQRRFTEFMLLSPSFMSGGQGRVQRCGAANLGEATDYGRRHAICCDSGHNSGRLDGQLHSVTVENRVSMTVPVTIKYANGIMLGAEY